MNQEGLKIENQGKLRICTEGCICCNYQNLFIVPNFQLFVLLFTHRFTMDCFYEGNIDWILTMFVIEIKVWKSLIA